ncbi:hypothetical protein BFP97_18230 [Roseivirga sp. 4D4]|nr:hypothetical protein BFP97_18230 [Roseivirga sp. 4D4]
MFLSFQALAQKQNDLINTWLPINVEDYTMESLSWESKLMLSLLTFKNDTSGQIGYGGTNFNRRFSYRPSDDGLEIELGNKESFKVLILEKSVGHLRILYDSFNIVTYTPLHAPIEIIDLEKLRTALIGKTWEFRIKHQGRRDEIPVDFRKGIQDSSLIRSQFIKYSNDAYLPSFLELDDYPHLWNISQSNSNTILRFEAVGISDVSVISSSLLFIETYNRNTLKGYLWKEGRKIRFTASLRKNSERIKARNLSNLTAVKWKLENAKPEKIRRIRKRDLIDLGTIGGDFIEYTPPNYLHDSSRVVLQSDITEKRLVFDFKQDSSYTILRDSQLISSGNWQGLFNLSSIKFESKTGEDEDGILRGHIEVLSLSKKKLVIKRRFFQRLNNQFEYPKGLIETYRPEKSH